LLDRKRKQIIPAGVVARLRRGRCGEETSSALTCRVTPEIPGFALFSSDDAVISTDREAPQVWTWVVIPR
jgi:hypothetical protein